MLLVAAPARKIGLRVLGKNAEFAAEQEDDTDH